jgi:hypothetical protein
MRVRRLDLDGTGSPEGIVGKILKEEPDLVIPVDIEALARQLDITDIIDLTTEGFEGGLITDDCRSQGTILVNKSARRGRRRFTVGHELGHFLIPTHKPVKGDQFLCSREDMRRWSAKENDTYARMEVEANRFSALMLMPPRYLRAMMGKFRDPNLAQVVDVAGHFDVSKDAAARAYATYHEEKIAIAVIKDGTVLRIYRNLKFPRITVGNGSPVPRNSLYNYAKARGAELTEITANGAELWIESEWGKRLPSLYEQVFFQQEGFALLMLWIEDSEDDDEEDEDERRTSKERYRHRQSSRRDRW